MLVHVNNYVCIFIPMCASLFVFKVREWCLLHLCVCAWGLMYALIYHICVPHFCVCVCVCVCIFWLACLSVCIGIGVYVLAYFCECMLKFQRVFFSVCVFVGMYKVFIWVRVGFDVCTLCLIAFMCITLCVFVFACVSLFQPASFSFSSSCITAIVVF